jgi:hypothetical protein
MNKQAIFDKVVGHLRMQGCRSIFSDTLRSCAYRGKEGRKCAIGVLIEDSEYAPWMEGRPLSDIVVNERCPISLRERLDPHQVFLSHLQMIHDSKEVNEWEWEFKHAARLHGTVYGPPHRMTE